jgi:hypothetical protein
MKATNLSDWWDRFLQQLQEARYAAPLKEASLAENLPDWTRLTTEAVVRSCESLGWEAAARGHRSNRLPESASEYLALDAMAFPHRDESSNRWPLPLAVFELENSPRDDRVGYSLWKVLCVRTPLRMVYAYRRDWTQTRDLMDHLATSVVASLSPTERVDLAGETAVVTGSRGESETFPHGYFKLWLLDSNLGKFERI